MIGRSHAVPVLFRCVGLCINFLVRIHVLDEVELDYACPECAMEGRWSRVEYEDNFCEMQGIRDGAKQE
jgi:hypothetical protein